MLSTNVPLSSNLDFASSWLKNKLLKKGENAYKVAWFYRLDSDFFTSKDTYSDSEFIPIGIATGKMFLKKNELYPELRILGDNFDKANAVVTKNIALASLNPQNAETYLFDSESVIGDNYYTEKESVFIKEDNPSVSLVSSGIITPYFTGLPQERSPMSLGVVQTYLARTDLSNVKTIYMLEGRELSSDYDIITEGILSYELEQLIDKTVSELPIDFKVKSSIGQEAININALRLIFRESISSVLSDRIGSFIKSSSSSSIIDELIAYIEDKLKELNDVFATKDMCKEMPLSIVEEGCIIPCNDVFVGEDNRLITKQRLKSAFICDTRCKGN